MKTQASSGPLRTLDVLYLFVLTLTVPMDWFGPTGLAFREFGAKPAILLMFCAALAMGLHSGALGLRLTRAQAEVIRPLALTFGLGCLAFFVNILMRWSMFGRAKDPAIQFAGQSGLYAALLLVVLTHGQYFRLPARREFFIRSMVPVTIVFLMAVIADAAGLLNHAHGILSLFHTEAGYEDNRPSGLFSEPSYFGAFAGLYGTPLVMGRAGGRRTLRAILGVSLFVTALAIRAKTFIPVVGFQFLVLFFRPRGKRSRLMDALGAVAVLSTSVYLIVSNSALDLRENLSSAMRFGSTMLCLRASFAGYGVLGVGFGQFHFFYRPEFAPAFLNSSYEALATMAPNASSRASAFNLYARLLLETGVIGVGAFLLAIRRAMKGVESDWSPHAEFGTLITAGSLGFLMTQDSLFLPSMALGLAFLIGLRDDLVVPSRGLRIIIGLGKG